MQASLQFDIYRKCHEPSFSLLFMKIISVFSKYSIRYRGGGGWRLPISPVVLVPSKEQKLYFLEIEQYIARR